MQWRMVVERGGAGRIHHAERGFQLRRLRKRVIWPQFAQLAGNAPPECFPWALLQGSRSRHWPPRSRIRLGKAVPASEYVAAGFCGRIDAYARASVATSPSRGATVSEKPLMDLRPVLARSAIGSRIPKDQRKLRTSFLREITSMTVLLLRLTKCRNPLLQRVNAEVAQPQSGVGYPSKFMGHCGNGLAMTVGLPRGAGTRNGVA
jgi:hypothetical protein